MVLYQKVFNPDQPRDEDGKWSSGEGGGSGGGGGKFRSLSPAQVAENKARHEASNAKARQMLEAMQRNGKLPPGSVLEFEARTRHLKAK